MGRLEVSELADMIRLCSHCSARIDAKKPVPGDGPSTALLIFIGRNPGKNEDAQNKPFIGRAGVLLNRMIDSLGFKRNECAILNTVKCFTKMNRAPTSDEIQSCLPWLKKELFFFPQKRAIITLGSEAFQAFFPQVKDKISASVGKAYKPAESKIATIALFHPAYLLRNPSEETKMFQVTLPRIKSYLEEHLKS